MSDTNLDWTFDDIPGEDEPTAAGPAKASPRAAPARPRRALPRWLLIVLPAVGLALALGAVAFTRLGWSRLQAQVAAEVAFEDERSAAQDVAAVRAMQSAAEPVWVMQREAEAGLGLPAPLPAANLLPSGAAPRVVAFRTGGNNQFFATVVRKYADSAGQTFEFELVQRYHNLSPGLWERLPTDSGALANTTVFVSDHLSATFPVADLPWLREALPQFEGTLARACIDWQCPPGLKLNVVFGAPAHSASSVLRATRPASRVSAGYPIVFDLPPLSASDPRRYRLPSPQTNGYPRDARAAAALTRGATAQLLAALATELTGDNRRSPDYFLDALIARAEIRLGLSAAPELAFTPYEYISPTMLWSMVGQRESAAVTDLLALRFQALGFMDFALAGQPDNVDGDLLRQVRQHNSPSAWLSGVLGDEAKDVQARWRQAALARSPLRAAPQAEYEGLVLVCGENTLVVGAEGVQSISARPQGQQVISAERSPDGRRLAALIAGRSTTKLVLFDLIDGSQQPLPVAQPGVLLGWRPTGELLYLEVHPANGSSSFWRLMRLRQYDPAQGGTFSTLLEEPIVLPWSEQGLWSPDRRTLSLAVFRDGHAADAPPELVLLTPGEPLVTRVLPTPGYAPAFAPSGDRLAVFSGGDPFGAAAADNWRLNVIDLRQDQLMTVLTDPEVGGGQYDLVGALDWSADGRWLSFIAAGPGVGPLAFLAAAAGGQVLPLDVGMRNAGAFPLGFSADSRYLAVTVFGGTAGANEIAVFDLADPAGSGPQRYLAHTAEWSPQGHHLLMGGPAGLYAVDPATGEFDWLYDTTCAVEFS